MVKPDALKALQEARKAAMARAEERDQEEQVVSLDLSIEEAVIQLCINMFASELKLGMGVMPDGMALYIRLSVPPTSKDPHAGYVAFAVSNEAESLLNKAIQAMEASVQSNWWKPDKFAGKS
jgi:hypothetical protein